MSSLSASAAAFKHQAKSAEVIPRFKVNKPSSDSDPFSELHDDVPRKRVKIEPAKNTGPPTISYSAGQEVITQMHYAMQYLKEYKNHEGKTTKELEGYLSLGGPLPPSLVHILRRNERIRYDSQTDRYSFRPVYNVRSAAQLLTFLERQEVPVGLSVKDLKEGWPECLDDLEDLESRGQVLLIRQKKDDKPRTVWRSLSEGTRFDDEFKVLFNTITIPPRGQLARDAEETEQADESDEYPYGGAKESKEMMLMMMLSMMLERLYQWNVRDMPHC